MVVVSNRVGAARPGGAGAESLVSGDFAGHGLTGVHELLECPVCTNSMYPPIHQVCPIRFLAFFFGSWLVGLPYSQLRVIW
jgi:hypothetical protein